MTGNLPWLVNQLWKTAAIWLFTLFHRYVWIIYVNKLKYTSILDKMLKMKRKKRNIVLQAYIVTDNSMDNSF